MTQRYSLTMAILVIFFTLSSGAVAEQSDTLFLLDPAVKSPQDARLPIVGSTKEWDILFNVDLIDEQRKSFALSLPGSKQTFQVLQTHFERYDFGGIQWVGKIASDQGVESGDIIINLVNDHIFGIIHTNDATYDIYTDSRVGTRLARIEGGAYFEGDTVERDDALIHAKHEALENVTTQHNRTYKNAPDISRVKVLVALDDELMGDDVEVSEIRSRFMTANYILQNSGENALNSHTEFFGGVPLRLEMVGPVYIDIPEEYEEIVEQNRIAFDRLTQGATPVSFELKEKLVISGADYVAVFLDFDPTSVPRGACGRGDVPTSSAQESSAFSFSVTMNSIQCTLSQYVLLHELMHNFGARHDISDDDPSFVPYARGFLDRPNSFATVMACVSNGLGADDDTCNRLPKLSSPVDMDSNGNSLGVAGESDNAKFLSDCDGSCRREDIANRQAINANINFRPLINITAPSGPGTTFDPIEIATTGAYELTADEVNDSDSVLGTWKITKATGALQEPLVQEGTGTGSNYSFITHAFSDVGRYRVKLTVLDNNNLSSTKEKTVVVTEAIPELTSARAVFGNRYSIELLGDKFNSDASVVVSDPRSDTANALPDDTYAGHLIFNRTDHPTLGVDRLIFPIVDPDYQEAFRNEGLCFKVFNNTNGSNEVCAVRPVWPAQGPFLGSVVESYSAGQDLHPEAYIVKGGGTVLKLIGNSWKKVAYDYNITANTVLQVDFKSARQEAEIVGVGVIMSDGSGGSFPQRFWQLHGTQAHGKQDFNNYSGNQTVTYTIPIGETLTGQMSHLVFVADEDRRVGQGVVFTSPQLKLQGADEYDDTINGPRTFTDDINGRAVPWTDASVNDVLHNLHDQGDVDWTIIYAEDFQVRTELIGTNIQPKISLYKWTAATPNQTLGYYTNVTDVLLQTSTNSWITPLYNYASQSDIYAVKVESPTGQFGADTEYRLIFEAPGGNAAASEPSILFSSRKE